MPFWLATPPLTSGNMQIGVMHLGRQEHLREKYEMVAVCAVGTFLADWTKWPKAKPDQ